MTPFIDIITDHLARFIPVLEQRSLESIEDALVTMRFSKEPPERAVHDFILDVNEMMRRDYPEADRFTATNFTPHIQTRLAELAGNLS